MIIRKDRMEVSAGRPSDDEVLRLVLAFLCIMEPARRSEVLALCEKYARESRVEDGVTHFLMLEPVQAKPADIAPPRGPMNRPN